MAELKACTWVDAPPEAVFAAFSDVRTATERVRAITAIEMLTEGPVGPLLFATTLPKHGIHTTFVDPSDLDNFRAAIATGQLPTHIDPRFATLGLFSYIDGLIYNWLPDPERVPRDTAAPPLVNTFLNGLRDSERS